MLRGSVSTCLLRLTYRVQILKQDFGVEAFISDAQLDMNAFSYVTNPGLKKSGEYTFQDPCATTIVYLILPARFAISTIGCDADDLMSGGAYVESCHTNTIDQNSLQLSPTKVARLAHAMKVLGLDVWVHPTQVQTVLSAYSPEDSLKHHACMHREEDTRKAERDKKDRKLKSAITSQSPRPSRPFLRHAKDTRFWGMVVFRLTLMQSWRRANGRDS